MSTYTDLHHKIKETLNVDYNNRISLQHVRLLNDRNQFRGQFEGSVYAKDFHMEGGDISGVVIRDSVLVDSKLSVTGRGIIDLVEFQNQFEELSDQVYYYIPLSLGMLDQDIAYVSANISGTMVDYEKFKHAVCCEISGLSVAMDGKLSAEEAARISSDAVIHSQLTKEAALRSAADAALCASEASICSEIYSDMGKLEERTLSTLEYEKHFKLYPMPLLDNPLRAREYSVNLLDQYNVPGGYVKSERTGQVIGKAVDIDGRKSITFSVFNAIPDLFLSALEPGQSYRLQNGIASDAKPGYKVCFSTNNVGRWGGEIYDLGNWYDLSVAGYGRVGSVTDCVFDAANPKNLIAGELHISAQYQPLDVFNMVGNFDLDHLSLTCENQGFNRVTFQPELQNFLMERNITIETYIKLSDDLGDRDTFAFVTKNGTLSDDNGIVSTDVEMKDGKHMALLRSAAYQAEYMKGDIPVNVSCNVADIENAIFDVTEKHFQYRYRITEEGDRTIDAVISATENHELSVLPVTAVIDVDLTNAALRPQFKNVYRLENQGGTNTWEFSQPDDGSGDSLHIVCQKDSYEFGLTATYNTERGKSSTIKEFELPETPDVFNPGIDSGEERGKCLHRIHHSKPADMTFVRDIYTKEKPQLPTYLANLGKYHSSDYHESLNVTADDLSVVVINLPDKPEGSDISREFDFVFKLETPQYDFMEIRFVNDKGEAIKYYNHRERFVMVPTNKYTTISLKEVRPNIFVVSDINENQQEWKLKWLKDHLLGLSGEVYDISSSLCSEISVNRDYIKDLYKQLSGGLVYKDTIDLSVHKYIVDDTISTLFFNNYKAKGIPDDDKIKGLPLRNGFYYIAECEDRAKQWVYSGLSIEHGDLIVIKENTLLSAMTSSSVNIVDIMDHDAVHEDRLCEVSASLCATAQLCAQTLQAEVTYVSSETAAVCADLSAAVDWISSEVSSNDNDISSISSDLGGLSALYHGTFSDLDSVPNKLLIRDEDANGTIYVLTIHSGLLSIKKI